MMTLEELDTNKKGMSEVARNARQASRLLDEIVTGSEEAIRHGIELAGPSHEHGHRTPVSADRGHQQRIARIAADRARPTTRSSPWSCICSSCNPNAR